MPIETILRPILDTVLDAVVVMDREGIIRAWNHHSETIFGWTADEAIGRNLGDLIVPPAMREAHHRGLARYNADGVAHVLDQRLELTGLRRDGEEIPVELSITLVSREGREMFVGFLRDISERRHAEAQVELQLRESRLMLELSELAGRDASFDQALVATLDAICELADWPVGHALLVDDDDCALRSAVWSTGAHEVARPLVEATAAIAFERGIGLPGQVLDSGQPVWLSVLEDADNFLRKGLGFASGFAFPVMSGGRCIAVLEFFSVSPRPPEPALLLSARAIGAQVGRVHERRRAEELQALLLAELNHRAKNILAVVRAIAHLSFGSAADLATAQAIFDKRLDSIAKANEILHAQSGQAALLGDIVTEALTGCAAPFERISIAGPELCIDSSTSITVSLAVHELCTNAFKYGALSVPGGTVALRWNESAGDDTRFDFEWVERGGPAAVAPSRKGFGMRILQRAMELESGGKAEIRFEPAGLNYRITGARHRGAPDRAKAA
ncbi:PAS domain S-box protein [Sphingomonas sp.]|uniref:sensor histidine kinase n=1 Tax=Sphingomonas sp. TaxID=28214 RepID=UPI00286D8FA3|nr:PAS domain S-box protein [Sphingomonas sp.]